LGSAGHVSFLFVLAGSENERPRAFPLTRALFVRYVRNMTMKQPTNTLFARLPLRLELGLLLRLARS